MSYADVNGISLYYEEHGSGRPLMLLHGGLSAASMYAPILPMLAKDRRVIAVDLQAHGHTADVDRPPLYEMYATAAPRVQDWPVLLDKAGDLLRQDFDWSADIAKITAQAMLVYADADAVRPPHIVDFYALLGGGRRDATWDGSARSVARLAILPSHTHYDIFGSPDLASAVIPFLDAPSLEPPAPFGQ